MTDNRSAGDHAPHASNAQPSSGASLSIRAGLSVSASLAMDAGFGIGPAEGPALAPARETGSRAAAAPRPAAGRPASHEEAADRPAPGNAAKAGKKPKVSPRRERARRRAAKRIAAANRSLQSAAAGEPSGATPGQAPGPGGEHVTGATGGSPGDEASGQAGSPERVVRVGSPSSLLALVPQLMGFEPRMSIVLLGAVPPRGRVRLTLRFDLPPAPDLAIADEVARHGLSVLLAQEFRTCVAVGYGPGRLVTPVADAIRRHAAGFGIRLVEVLRAEDGRYWSYLCAEPDCCSPDGEAYDAASHPVTAAFAAAGAPPVLADRCGCGRT
jgi:hypothetical protein